VVLNRGRVQQAGAPLEVYREPANRFVASFLGSPPANLLPARFDGDALAVADARLPVVRNGAPAEVIFAIRPEDIRLTDHSAHAQGEVLAVEPLGAETIVRLRLPGLASDVLVRGPRSIDVKAGERAPIAFDLLAAHLFDPATTRRIPNS
jgi:ABC-type sugar transport system ATPase subunit